MKRSLENRTLQPNLSLAIEKPDHVKVEISPDESDESLEFPEDIENTSNHNKKENVDNSKQENMNPDTGRNELIQEKRELKFGLKIECENLQKQYKEEMERNDQEENPNQENKKGFLKTKLTLKSPQLMYMNPRKLTLLSGNTLPLLLKNLIY